MKILLFKIFIVFGVMSCAVKPKVSSPIYHEVIVGSDVEYSFFSEDSINYDEGEININFGKEQSFIDTIINNIQLLRTITTDKDTFVTYLSVSESLDTSFLGSYQVSNSNAKICKISNKGIDVAESDLTETSRKFLHFLDKMNFVMFSLNIGKQTGENQRIFWGKDFIYTQEDKVLKILCNSGFGKGKYTFSGNQITFEEHENKLTKRSESSAYVDGKLDKDYIQMLLRSDYYKTDYYFTGFNFSKGKNVIEVNLVSDGNKLIKEKFMPIKVSHLKFILKT